MSTVLCLIKGPHAKPTDVAGGVVARRNRVVSDGVCADEADLGIVVLVGRFLDCGPGSESVCS